MCIIFFFPTYYTKIIMQYIYIIMAIALIKNISWYEHNKIRAHITLQSNAISWLKKNIIFVCITHEIKILTILMITYLFCVLKSLSFYCLQLNLSLVLGPSTNESGWVLLEQNHTLLEWSLLYLLFYFHFILFAIIPLCIMLFVNIIIFIS